MASGLPNADAKDRVRQAIDIVELVGEYLQLRREGRGYKALCPWHDDSRPSLQVNPERQSFRCWVCDVGGDVFSFMMKMEGVSFSEALTMLAERAGVALGPRAGDSSSADAKRLLYQAMAWAEQRYHECLLQSGEAAVARDYLHQRGITDESIKAFRLGFAPERWDWLLGEARQTRFTPQVLESVGLLSRSERRGGSHYDRFRARVLFSIRDVQGRPVGLGGRVLPGYGPQDAAKYLNSPETPLFNKSNLLYGLDVAKTTLAKTRTAIIMEGYTDCLTAHQCGFTGSLAVLGTALGERHLRLLKRYVDRVVLVLDGDEAGRRRTDQILELFVSSDVDLRILTLPENLDPCDFLRSRGIEQFGALLEGAVDALEHRFLTATAERDKTSGLFDATQAVESVLATLAKSRTLASGVSSAMQLKIDQVLQRLSARFGLDERSVRSRLSALRRGSATTPSTATPAQQALPCSPRMVKAERALLQLLIEDPLLWYHVSGHVRAEEFSCPRRRHIFTTFSSLAAADTPPGFERLMLEITQPEVQATLVELDEERRRVRRKDYDRELEQLLHAFADERTAAPGQSRVVAQAQAAQTPHATTTEEDEHEALRRLIAEKRSRQGISRLTDG